MDIPWNGTIMTLHDYKSKKLAERIKLLYFSFTQFK